MARASQDRKAKCPRCLLLPWPRLGLGILDDVTFIQDGVQPALGLQPVDVTPAALIAHDYHIVAPAFPVGLEVAARDASALGGQGQNGYQNLRAPTDQPRSARPPIFSAFFCSSIVHQMRPLADASVVAANKRLPSLHPFSPRIATASVALPHQGTARFLLPSGPRE